jgi:hypothetical protein
MSSAIVAQAIASMKKLAAEAVIKLIVAKAPFFAGRFVNPIISWLVPIIIDVLYDKGALAVNWMWINLDNNLELKAAIGSKEKLYAILQAGVNYAEAEKEFNKATDDIIRHEFNRLPR